MLKQAPDKTLAGSFSPTTEKLETLDKSIHVK